MGLALPLGMTKDPASGVIKPSLSAEGRTLLRTLGADRSKMTRCLRVGPRLLRSRESARDSGERPSLGRSLRCASSTLRLPPAGWLYPKASVTLRAMYGGNSSVRAKLLIELERLRTATGSIAEATK
jgi:hypothetical protein